MSYDFRLFKRRPGEDPNVTAQRESEEFGATPSDPEKEALKRRVADALIAHNPKLEILQFGYDEIAKHEGISIDQARLNYRHLELNGPEEDRTGIQITLFDDEASVTVPFWHNDDRAAEVFREIWGYLQILSREADYLTYDPQIDRVIDPSTAFDDSLNCYTGTIQQVDEMFPMRGAERRPWWKFW